MIISMDRSIFDSLLSDLCMSLLWMHLSFWQREITDLQISQLALAERFSFEDAQSSNRDEYVQPDRKKGICFTNSALKGK